MTDGGVTHKNQGRSRAGELTEARTDLERTIAEGEALLIKHPDQTLVSAVLMRSQRALADMLRRSGEAELAAKTERAARTHRRKLPQGSPPPR